jgi:maltose O-acetyltransferase
MSTPNEHTSQMTEREKMLAGLPYSAMDPELNKLRRDAKLFAIEFSQILAPYTPEDRLRYNQVLGKLLPNVNPNTTWIEPPFRVDYGHHITLGENFYSNVDCVMLDVCQITIGKNVFLAPGVHIYTATHPLDYKERRLTEFGKAVTIGDDVWIGGRVVINPGVNIGSRVVIASGAVVCGDVPDDCIVAGVPAKIKKRFETPEEFKIAIDGLDKQE